MAARLAPALLARAYDLLYGRLAWTYDAVAWAVSLGQWQAWGAAALPYLTGPRVLELGHGPGHMLVALAEHGFAPVGLDLSPQMGRLAARRQPAAPVVRGRAQAAPFAAARFDGALATFPTPYIVAPETAAAVFQLLRPGGRLVVVPEARLSRSGPLHALIDWLYAVTGQRWPANEDGGTRLAPWQAAFAPVGFRVSLHGVVSAGSVVTIIVAERPLARNA